MNEISQTTTTELRQSEMGIKAGEIAHSQNPGLYERYTKRGFDFLCSACLMLVLGPIMLIVILLIYRSSIGAPAIYRQDRVGRHGKSFTMLKFRSMKNDRREDYLSKSDFKESDRRLTHKTEKDPRHTRLGRFLRKTSLDELPQLINVLRGDMSLVGPRPEIVEVATRHNLINHPRHQVRPGITGLWQVSEHRSELLHENVHIDLEYVRKVTFLGDLKILMQTVTSIMSRTGK